MCFLLSFEVERISGIGANLGQLRGQCCSHDAGSGPYSLQRIFKACDPGTV